MLAVGFRHSTCVSRPAGAASRLVGLHTPPSTYSRPPIVTGANSHGTRARRLHRLGDARRGARPGCRTRRGGRCGGRPRRRAGGRRSAARAARCCGAGRSSVSSGRGRRREQERARDRAARGGQSERERRERRRRRPAPRHPPPRAAARPRRREAVDRPRPPSVTSISSLSTEEGRRGDWPAARCAATIEPADVPT